MFTRRRIQKMVEITREYRGNDGTPLYRKVAVIVLILTMTFSGATSSVQAFERDYHLEITRMALGSTPDDSFLRTGVRRDINNQHSWMDDEFPSGRVGHDEKHFDDCEFNGAAEFIREQYQDALTGLTTDRLWDTTFSFGNILHTVQDFYSHSNWVELGFPLSNDPEIVSQSDLVDLSGAQSTLAQRWFAPDGGEVVRGDILLAGDDWDPIPAGWSIERNGAGLFVPTLVDAQGRTLGRLLQTGKGSGDDECEVWTLGPPLSKVFNGVKHNDNLNKDCPDCGASDVPLAHAKARALATLQTGYEWCRLVYEAAQIDRDGLLLALWVRTGGNPHPPGTPCATAAPGLTRFVVTIESIRILDARDDDDDPGEIQLAAVLYDDPQNFHRSLHVTNRQGRMELRTGDFVPAGQIPEPLSLCISQAGGTTFTLHAWDNDDALDDEYGLEFDNRDDDDEVLFGFQVRFGAQPPAGVQVAQGEDLEVRYRVSRVDNAVNCWPGADPTPDVTDDMVAL